jgi:glycosyltransferase involved in cell wall biosynthesis
VRTVARRWPASGVLREELNMGESTEHRSPRVLIFVVAYEAESTLSRVLMRIPPSIWALDVEVLVIDDSSRDRTFEIGLLTAETVGHPVTVLCNATNQGYGGNQKLGYAYALRHGFDFVVLLHGDGQYAPECIPDLLRPLIDGAADAVFGSRMLVRGAARRGGMPLYKFAGNKALTWFQNRLLGVHLSEFHSGFRAYRVSALGTLPFERNSNVFHFDTEIIIQLLLGGFRVVEVPIPTYYGDEICRVEGLKYAKDVVLATVGSRLHRLNILYDRKYDVDSAGNRRYGLKLGYASSHTAALDAIPDGSRVLDIGCGPGDFARELRKKHCAVDGADQAPPAGPSPFGTFTLWREPEPLHVDLRQYDSVLLLDIVEHLQEPEQFLDALRRAARSRQPRFIVTTGNVTFCVVRFQALLGNFNYGRRGILDLTHTRLYTFRTLRLLFEQCGFRVERIAGIPAPFPLALGPGRLGRALVKINTFLIRLSRGLFSYQVFLIASPLPTVDALLDDAVAGSTIKADAVRRRTAEDAESPAALDPL